MIATLELDLTRPEELRRNTAACRAALNEPMPSRLKERLRQLNPGNDCSILLEDGPSLVPFGRKIPQQVNGIPAILLDFCTVVTGHKTNTNERASDLQLALFLFFQLQPQRPGGVQLFGGGGAARTPKLTANQRRLLKTLARLTKKLGHPPTFRELARAKGVTSVQGVLKALREKGFVTWEPGKRRTIRLTDVGVREVG